MKTALALIALVSIVAASGSCSTAGNGKHHSGPAKFEIRVVLAEAPASTVVGWIDPRGTQAKVVTSSVADSALSALHREGEITSRPKIVVAAGATAELSKTDTLSYVRDFNVGQEPIMAKIEEGEWIRATPAVADGDRVEVAFSVELVDVKKPMRELTVRQPGTSNPLALQVPEKIEFAFHGTITLAEDEAALIPLGGPKGPNENRARIGVLRVRRVD